jgi:hypothetical protein
MYTVELNIKNLDEELIKLLIHTGELYNFNVDHHGSDRLVFWSTRGLYFTNLIETLNNVCKIHKVKYLDLLDLN